MNLESCLAESTRRLDRAFLESKSSELGVILVEFSKRAIAWHGLGDADLSLESGNIVPLSAPCAYRSKHWIIVLWNIGISGLNF